MFALVARIETARVLLQIAAQFGWKVYHLDVKLVRFENSGAAMGFNETKG